MAKENDIDLLRNYEKGICNTKIAIRNSKERFITGWRVDKDKTKYMITNQKNLNGTKQTVNINNVFEAIGIL